jgi:hypothetical protein
MNYLVETKTEYTIQLTNILIPLIYEGISSIYDDAVKVASQNEELKTFQLFLKKIPKWNNILLDNETNRILCLSTCPDLLKDLINAVIKANIMILTNTPPSEKSSLKITTKLDFKEFIHNCYIESARTFYNNPFLFYHKYPIYDLNRNQKDAKENIKNAIIEAIRKMLPLKMIINEYLGNSFKEDNNININIDNTLSEVEKENLNTMIKADNIKTINSDIIKSIKSEKIIESKKIEPEHEPERERERERERELELELEREREREQELEPEPEHEPVHKPEYKKEHYECKHSCKEDKEQSIKSNKSFKKKLTDDCDSVSYYKIDEKNKVLDSYSNNLNSNTQQIFYKNFSVELTEENKGIMSGYNKGIMSEHKKSIKIRKLPNI